MRLLTLKNIGYFSIFFSFLFLYREVLVLLNKDTGLTITVLRSIPLFELPVVILPYLTTLFFMMFSIIWVPLKFVLPFARKTIQSSLKKNVIFYLCALFLVIPFYGLLATVALVSLYGVLYEGSLFVVFEKPSQELYNSLTEFYITITTGILVTTLGLYFILLQFVKKHPTIPWRKEQKGHRYISIPDASMNFGITAVCVLLLLLPISIKSSGSYDEFGDIRSCIKFSSGYDLYQKKTVGNNLNYYLTGFIVSEQDKFITVVTTDFAQNPKNEDDFTPLNTIIFADKEKIDFVEAKRCTAHFAEFNADNYKN